MRQPVKQSGTSPLYVMRASPDERKRGQSDSMVDAYHLANYPGYAYWFEAQLRDGEWVKECQRCIQALQAEHGDELSTLAQKELAVLQRDMAAAKARQLLAQEKMREAA